jgi:hypothetical protein
LWLVIQIKKGFEWFFNHSIDCSGLYQPQPPKPPQQPQQLKQPQQPPKPPKPPKPPPPHANAWWVDTIGPAANSNTAAATAMMLNTTLVFVFICTNNLSH